MYSNQIEPVLKSAGIKIGERLRYEREGWSIEGLLMPRPDVGDPDCIVLKLSSGYNIGLCMEGAKIEKIKGEAVSIAGRGGSKESVSAPAQSSPSPHRPHIFLLSTGGTITSKVDYVTGAVHPVMDAEQLLSTYPRLAPLGPFKSVSLMRILSEDMHPLRWTTLARGVADALRDGSEGIVITHGTDTMGYSAAALSFALQNLPVPVLLTGAQRSPDRGSSDAGDNLFCAAAAARANFAGVGLCMPTEPAGGRCNLHLGTRVRKCHTSARWAFRSIGAQPFGTVDMRTGDVRLEPNSPVAARDHSRSLHMSEKFSENVHLAWVYPGLTPKTVSSWADYDGVVLAATGLGNAPVSADEPNSPRSVLPAIRELVESGVIVAIAPQTLEGRINMDVYSAGRLLHEAGVIGQGADWLPETAYAKLCWALGQGHDAALVKKLMMTPIAGDITPRSGAPDGLGQQTI